MMSQPGKSDKAVVPEKSSNKTRTTAAEGREGRGLDKGNSDQQNASRTLGRSDAHSALERVRGTARRNKEIKFTALMHHIYNLETLRAAYYQLKKEAAPGVDGETWQHYGEALEENLQDLSHRLRRGAYQAKPVRRGFTPTGRGRRHPAGGKAPRGKTGQPAAGGGPHRDIKAPL